MVSPWFTLQGGDMCDLPCGFVSYSVSLCLLGTTGGGELAVGWLRFQPKPLKNSLQLELRHLVQA